MADNTCKTCRWFVGFKLEDESDHGSYDPMTVATGQALWGICSALPTTAGDADLPSKSGARAYTKDGSMYWSALCVREDFGCVEHDLKENDDSAWIP